MDKLSEHAIRMLEIADGENDFFRNDNKRQADIARAVYDTILQVQMLKMADRKVSEIPTDCETCLYTEECDWESCRYEPKTEPNCSEKPNNCTDCECTDDCSECKEAERGCKDEPTISKMEQVDKDTNVRSKDCTTCKHDLWHTPRMCGKCVRQEDGKPSMYEPKTEPHKCYLRESCDHYGDKQVCGRCREYNLYSHTKTEPNRVQIVPKDEPQTLKGGEDVHEFCKRCGESKARTIDGERYIVCEKASDMVCVSIKKCPLGKWVCEDTYIVVPQTDCAWKKGE